jgi:hypothetical protein
MTPEQFAYWLQGFFELRAADPEMAGRPITPAQEKMIRDHLSLVFVKVTPPFVMPPPAAPPVDQPPVGPYYPWPPTTDPGLPFPGFEIICSAETGTKSGWTQPGRSYCEDASTL